RPMVVAADGFGIHQVDAALLAGIHHKFAALVIEDGGGDLHVEVALHQPLGVRGAVVVVKHQGFGLRVLLHADDAVAVDSVFGVPAAVAGAGIHDSRGTDGGSCT